MDGRLGRHNPAHLGDTPYGPLLTFGKLFGGEFSTKDVVPATAAGTLEAFLFAKSFPVKIDTVK